MTAGVHSETVARGVLEELAEDRMTLHVPGTDYRIHLVPAVPASSLRPSVGRRVRGVINAAALRIHPAKGGGRFIEPVIGMPRIVAGTVLWVDEAARKVGVNVAVPMVIETLPEQDFRVLEVGHLVNCYVKSGATFTPVDEA